MFESIKKKILKDELNQTNMVMIDAKELAALRLRATDTRKLTPEQLTQHQLGSYVPNFVDISKQSDAFKNSLGQLCSNLMNAPEWEYLMNHLKQDQVNRALFTEGITVNDGYVRGSINGIYVVDDIVGSLGISYDERAKAGMVKG